MTTPYSAHGAQLQVGNSSTPTTYTTLAELTKIVPPAQEYTEIDATSHDSAAAEYIAGRKRNTPVEAEGMLVDAAARTQFTGSVAYWQLSLADFGQTTSAFTVTTGSSVTALNFATAHGCVTGTAVRVSTTGTLPTGLSAGRTYWINATSANAITLHTTNAAAVAGTGAVEMSTNGSGTHSLLKPTRFTFAGNILAYQNTAPEDGALGQTFSITVTGDTTIS
jgi:hypothetical protein